MASHALGIVEIVRTILTFADTKTLHAAARVNRTWAGQATDLIWRGELFPLENRSIVPGLESIAECSDERRRWYLTKARYVHMDFSGHSASQRQAVLGGKNVVLAQARHIHLDLGEGDIPEWEIVQLLPARLASLEIEGGRCSEWLLKEIPLRCPYLLSVKILPLEHSEITPRHLLDFLKAMPTIKHLQIPFLDDPNILEHVVRRPKLEKLSGYESTMYLNELTPGTDDTEPAEPIFPDLKCLESVAPYDTIAGELALDFSKFRELKVISISIYSPAGPDTLDTLSACFQLQELSIWCSEWEAVADEALANFARCTPMLRKFETGSLQACEVFNGEILTNIASKWSLLEHITIPSARIAFTSLASLAAHCPYLQTMDVDSDVDLFQLEHLPQQLKFRSLESFALNEGFGLLCYKPRDPTDDEGNPSEDIKDRVVRLLDERFPVLHKLEEKTYDDVADELPWKRVINDHLKKRPAPQLSLTLSAEMSRMLIEPRQMRTI